MISHRLENSRRGDLVSVSRRDELLDNLSARNVTAVFRLGEKLLGHRQLFRYNSRRMSRAEKLFDKLTAGRNDANFSFDDLCTLLTKLGYNARKTKGSRIIFQRGSSFLNLQPSPAERQNLIRYGKYGTSCKN